MEGSSKAPIKIYGNDALSSRVAAFQKKAEEHKTKQKSNPFSQGGNVSGMVHTKWDKSDPRYGRPAEGSKTDQRGRAAGTHIGNEIYTTISNKVVGILLRARKQGLLYFEGEMLYQRRDDDVIITLLKPISELCPNRAPPPKRKHDEDEPMGALSPEDY